MRRAALLVALVALALVGPAGVASARLPAPIGLEVTGGEETWHPENRFTLRWTNPDTGFSLPITDVVFAVRNPSGAVIKEGRLGWAGQQIDNLTIPGSPGAYTVRVWFEDRVRRRGPGDRLASLRRCQSGAGARGRAGPVARPLRLPPSARDRTPAGPPSGIRHPRLCRLDRPLARRPAVRGAEPLHRHRDRPAGRGRRRLAADRRTPRGGEPRPCGRGVGLGVPVCRHRRHDPSRRQNGPATHLSGVTSGWTNRAVPVTVTATDGASGMEGDGAFTAIQIDGGLPTVEAGRTVSSTVIGDGVHRIAHYARDAAGNVNDGATRNGVRNLLPAISTVRVDRDPPEVAFLDSQDPADPELIRAEVADALSGPSADRGLIAVRALGSGDRFAPIPTQVVDGGLRARWDSEEFPSGRYEFRATGYDDAGNATTTQMRFDRSVMALANPLKAQTALSIGFGGERLIWQNCTRSNGGRRCRREAVSALESAGETAAMTSCHIVAHFYKIDADALDSDAEVSCIAYRLGAFGRCQQRFRRYASGVEAIAARLAALRPEPSALLRMPQRPRRRRYRHGSPPITQISGASISVMARQILPAATTLILHGGARAGAPVPQRNQQQDERPERDQRHNQLRRQHIGCLEHHAAAGSAGRYALMVWKASAP